MVVIGHQDPGVKDPAMKLDNGGESFDKEGSITIGANDVTTFVSA